jgi:hypothetical protein
MFVFRTPPPNTKWSKGQRTTAYDMLPASLAGINMQNAGRALPKKGKSINSQNGLAIDARNDDELAK